MLEKRISKAFFKSKSVTCLRFDDATQRCALSCVAFPLFLDAVNTRCNLWMKEAQRRRMRLAKQGKGIGTRIFVTN